MRQLALTTLIVGFVLCIGIRSEAVAEETRTTAPSVGLAVEPGGLLIQGVEPGGVYDLADRAGVLLTIHNRDRIDHTYVLTSHRPSEVGAGRVPEGYADLPDPSWFWCEQSELDVPGGSSGHVRMCLRIPEEDRYHNQHWSVSVGVSGKPEPGETLTLAVYPRYEIETAVAARPQLEEMPAGAVAVCPSIVEILLGAENEPVEASFLLGNNDRQTHSYVLGVLKEGAISAGRQIFPSGGWTWGPEGDWLSVLPPRLDADPRRTTRWSAESWPSVWLAGGATAYVRVRVTPAEELAPQAPGWEGIVFITRDDGRTGFVRVRATSADAEEG